MKDIRQELESLLNNSTPEQLRDELKKGNRPVLQTVNDALLLTESEFLLAPAFVSFFQGAFAEDGPAHASDDYTLSQTCLAANQELALAA